MRTVHDHQHLDHDRFDDDLKPIDNDSRTPIPPAVRHGGEFNHHRHHHDQHHDHLNHAHLNHARGGHDRFRAGPNSAVADDACNDDTVGRVAGPGDSTAGVGHSAGGVGRSAAGVGHQRTGATATGDPGNPGAAGASTCSAGSPGGWSHPIVGNPWRSRLDGSGRSESGRARHDGCPTPRFAAARPSPDWGRCRCGCPQTPPERLSPEGSPGCSLAWSGCEARERVAFRGPSTKESMRWPRPMLRFLWSEPTTTW